MLTISDNVNFPAPHYITKVIGNNEKNNTRIGFDVTPNLTITNDITIARFKGIDTMSSVILGANNEIRLTVNDRISGLLNFVALKTIPGTFRISFNIISTHTQFAESNLYVERIGGRYGIAYASGVNWNRENVSAIDLGQISSSTPYSLTFDNINLIGDVPDPKWFSLRGYHGFKGSGNLTWIGASITEDVSTYSERTNLPNLARYDYALALIPGAAIWGMKETFDDLKYSTFAGNYLWGSNVRFEQISENVFSSSAYLWSSDKTFNEVASVVFSYNAGTWVWGSNSTFNQLSSNYFALGTGVRWSI